MVVFEHITLLSKGEIMLNAEETVIKTILPNKFIPSNIPKALNKSQRRQNQGSSFENRDKMHDKFRKKKKRLF